MQNLTKWIPAIAIATVALFLTDVAMADPEAVANTLSDASGYIGLGAGVAIGFAVLGGGIGQGLAARGVLESIARNPQASSKLNAPFFIGMALIESLVIFAWLMAYFLQGHIA